MALLVVAAPVVAPAAAQEAPAVATNSAQPATPAETPAPAAGPLHLSLETAVKNALDANPGLKALGHRSAAAERTARATERTRWGQIDAFFSYSKFNDSWIVRPMSEELFLSGGGFTGLPWDRNQQHYGATFQVPLYLGGKLSNGIKIARLESGKTAALLEGTRWQVRFNATSLYTAAQTLDAVTTALTELERSLEKTKSRLDLMVESGKRPEVDRLKVVEQLEDTRAQLESARADRTKVVALLLALMGRDPSQGVSVDPLPTRVPESAMSRNELRQAIATSSPVRSANLAAEQSESGVKVAKSSFIPKIVAGGNYTQNAAPSLDDTLDTWQVSVGVKIPLFYGGSRFEALAAAKEKQSAAEEALTQVQLKTAASLEDAIAAFTAAKAQLTAARARVAAGVEAARIEQIRYDTGAGTIEDLLRAQAREESAKAALAHARGGVITAAERINTIVETEAFK